MKNRVIKLATKVKEAQSAKEMVQFMDKQVDIAMEKLIVTCVVKDVRSSWGKVQLLVNPIAGSGEQWVAEERVVSKGEEL